MRDKLRMLDKKKKKNGGSKTPIFKLRVCYNFTNTKLMSMLSSAPWKQSSPWHLPALTPSSRERLGNGQSGKQFYDAPRFLIFYPSCVNSFLPWNTSLISDKLFALYDSVLEMHVSLERWSCYLNSQDWHRNSSRVSVFPAVMERWGKEREDGAVIKGYSTTLLLESKISLRLKHPIDTHALERETGSAQAAEGLIVIANFFGVHLTK